MSTPQALTASAHRTPHTCLLLLVFMVAFVLFGSNGAAHAVGGTPEKPQDLIYVSEGAEISEPDMENITALMTGLNDAHVEKVGVIITHEDVVAQALANDALTKWGLDENGAVIVITTKDQGVALSVATGLTDRVSQEDRDDVVNKVTDGIGQYADWASGIQRGATRLFQYIEDQGLGGGTDAHADLEEGHSHDNPAVGEAPAGEIPGDTDAEGQAGSGAEASESNTAKVIGGVAIALLAGVGLFFIVRNGRRKAARDRANSRGGASSQK